MKRVSAYMTVEAALIIPIVMGSILFVVYMMLFQYKRCLLEQDLGAAALWGSLAEAADTAELENKVQKRMSEIYRDKYVVWRFRTLNASLEKNRFFVKGEGYLSFPFAGLNYWKSGNTWGVQAEYGYNRLAAVTFIRMCHKFQKAVER